MNPSLKYNLTHSDTKINVQHTRILILSIDIQDNKYYIRCTRILVLVQNNKYQLKGGR